METSDLDNLNSSDSSDSNSSNEGNYELDNQQANEQTITDDGNNTLDSEGNPSSSGDNSLQQSPFGRLTEVVGEDNLASIFGGVGDSSGENNPFSGAESLADSDLPYGGNPFAGDNFWNIFAGGVNPANPNSSTGEDTSSDDGDSVAGDDNSSDDGTNTSGEFDAASANELLLQSPFGPLAEVIGAENLSTIFSGLGNSPDGSDASSEGSNPFAAGGNPAAGGSNPFSPNGTTSSDGNSSTSESNQLQPSPFGSLNVVLNEQDLSNIFGGSGNSSSGDEASGDSSNPFSSGTSAFVIGGNDASDSDNESTGNGNWYFSEGKWYLSNANIPTGQGSIPMVGDGNSFAADNSSDQNNESLAADSNPFASGSNSSAADNSSDEDSESLAADSNPFASGNNPFADGGNLIPGGINPFTSLEPSTDANSPFSDGNQTYNNLPLPFENDNWISDISNLADDHAAATGNETIGNGNWHFASDNKIVGNGNWTFGSDNATLGNGNWYYENDNATIGNGNWYFGNCNSTIGNGNWSYGSGNAIIGNGNKVNGHDNIVIGNAVNNGDWLTGDGNIIISSDDKLLVASRDAIGEELDELMTDSLINSIFSGDISNDKLNAGINSLIDQVSQGFLDLLGSGGNGGQPTLAQGTGSNDSSTLSNLFNSDQFTGLLFGSSANTSINSDSAVDIV